MLSMTVMVKVPCERFPEASTAVAVTTVVPMLNTLPEGGSEMTTGFGSQSSVAVTM
jgi:hypothetical protein